jgi:hypothetical protein
MPACVARHNYAASRLSSSGNKMICHFLGMWSIYLKSPLESGADAQLASYLLLSIAIVLLRACFVLREHLVTAWLIMS